MYFCLDFVENINNMSIHQNIKLLRTRKNMSQAEAATALQMTRSQIAGYETTINPPIEALVKLADFFNVTIDTLIRTDLSTYSAFQWKQLDNGFDAYLKGGNLRVLATTVTEDNEDRIEVVPVKARAGYLAGYADPEFMAELPTLAMPFLKRGGKHRVFQIDGDSMPPVEPGSYVVGRYVDDWTQLKDGIRYIVVTQSEGVVMKMVYKKLGQNPRFLLSSTNPIYAPYEMPAEDVVEIWQVEWVVS